MAHIQAGMIHATTRARTYLSHHPPKEIPTNFDNPLDISTPMHYIESMATNYQHRNMEGHSMMNTVAKATRVGGICQASDAVGDLKQLIRKLEYSNTIPDDAEWKIRALESAVADLRSIMLGLDILDDQIRDAIGEDCSL